MDDRLQQVFGAVVPSDEQVKFKVTEEKNAGPGSLSQILAHRTFPKSYEIFLVNESNDDITDVDMATGGFEGDMSLNVVIRKLGPIKRGAARLIEELDLGMLDFVLWYHLTLSFVGGTQPKACFYIGKAHSLTRDRYEFCSALRKHAYRFPLTLQS